MIQQYAEYFENFTLPLISISAYEDRLVDI